MQEGSGIVVVHWWMRVDLRSVLLDKSSGEKAEDQSLFSGLWDMQETTFSDLEV